MTTGELAGLRIAAGFDGYDIPDGFRELVLKHQVSNVILFKRNVQSAGQLKSLCAGIRELIITGTGHPPLIAIDQEGGTVSRLDDIAAHAPSAMALAATGDPRTAYEAGFVMGREMTELGINLDLAPDLDINVNSRNPVIGVRSFGDSAGIVSLYGTQMIRGLLDGGLLCCAKHFPGHGDTSADSHFNLPRIDKTAEEMEACELVPFRAAIASGVSAVMTAHILFPGIEQENVPATMSRSIVTGLLKEKMGFRGLVLSDCMMMQAVSDRYGTVNGCVAAVRAGVDIMFVSHSLELAADACAAIEKGFQEGTLSLEEAEASAQKIIAYKERFRVRPPSSGLLACRQHADMMRKAMAHSVTFAGGPGGSLPPLGEHPLFIGPGPFRQSPASDDPQGSFSFPAALRGLLGGDMQLSSPDPGPDEIRKLSDAAAGHSVIVAGTCNGHLMRGQLTLVSALCDTGLPVICVALKNPYDLADFLHRAWCIALYEYSETSVSSVADVLSGREKMTGILPVTIGQ